MHSLKRNLIWLKRIRHRCGYGVHSPFAFDLITTVIYEKTLYYAYREIEQIAGEDKTGKINEPTKRTTKINRLLFRLVNRSQPQSIIDLGGSPYTSSYLRKAKRAADYYLLTSFDIRELPAGLHIGFLHLNCPEQPLEVKKVFEYAAGRIGQKSVFTIQGIHHSKAMKALWKQIKADERVGITFDLYDLGILFFDKSKIKQHYLVNF